MKQIRKFFTFIRLIKFNPYEHWFEFKYSKLQYKWKFDTPRVESLPYLKITLFAIPFEFTIGNTAYWEQQIWIKYHNYDVKKAKETWSWKDTNGNSSWNKRYE